MVGQALVLALSALGVDSWGVTAAPQACATGGATVAACGAGCGGSGCGLGRGLCDCLGDCWGELSRCVHCMNGMPQHFPYPNPAWGYYFFRPYNYTVLAEQQAEIAAMGGNPIQPYDNRFFQRIYQEVEALPAASPVPEPYPVPPPSVPPVMPVPASDPLPRLPALR